MYCRSMVKLLSRSSFILFVFFFNDTATTEIYTLSLHDALPILHSPFLSITTTSTVTCSTWAGNVGGDSGDRTVWAMAALLSNEAARTRRIHSLLAFPCRLRFASVATRRVYPLRFRGVN